MLDFLLLIDILLNIHPSVITSQQNMLFHWRSSTLPYILLNTEQRVSSPLAPQRFFQNVTLLPLLFRLLGRFSFPFPTLISLSSLLVNQLSLYPSELSSNVISSRKVSPSRPGLGAHCHCSSAIWGHLCHSLCLGVLLLLLTTGSLRWQIVFYI